MLALLQQGMAQKWTYPLPSSFPPPSLLLSSTFPHYPSFELILLLVSIIFTGPSYTSGIVISSTQIWEFKTEIGKLGKYKIVQHISFTFGITLQNFTILNQKQNVKSHADPLKLKTISSTLFLVVYCLKFIKVKLFLNFRRFL